MKTHPIYKDFDLPTKHLPEAEHYVPPKARDEGEIERRRGLPTGSLMAEYQRQGLVIASTILEFLEEPRDIEFSARLLAVSGLNSAWYSFAQNSEVMRRRLKLPLLIRDHAEDRPNSAQVMEEAKMGFKEAYVAGHQVVRHLTERREVVYVENYRTRLGRHLGNASLKLGCAQMADLVVQASDSLTDHDVQAMVRQRSLYVLDDARVLKEEVGSHPSIAQLADPDSDLSVYWRRQAPNGALGAYEMATELVAA